MKKEKPFDEIKQEVLREQKEEHDDRPSRRKFLARLGVGAAGGGYFRCPRRRNGKRPPVLPTALTMLSVSRSAMQKRPSTIGERTLPSRRRSSGTPTRRDAIGPIATAFTTCPATSSNGRRAFIGRSAGTILTRMTTATATICTANASFAAAPGTVPAQPFCTSLIAIPSYPNSGITISASASSPAGYRKPRKWAVAFRSRRSSRPPSLEHKERRRSPRGRRALWRSF